MHYAALRVRISAGLILICGGWIVTVPSIEGNVVLKYSICNMHVEIMRVMRIALWLDAFYIFFVGWLVGWEGGGSRVERSIVTFMVITPCVYVYMHAHAQNNNAQRAYTHVLNAAPTRQRRRRRRSATQ